MRSLLRFGCRSKGQRDEIDIGSRCDIPACFCARTKQETFALRRSRNFVAGLKLQADGRRVREDVSIPLALFPLRKLTFALQHRSEKPSPRGEKGRDEALRPIASLAVNEKRRCTVPSVFRES